MSMARVRLGRQGERLAQQHLLKAGYRIVTANYRCRWGEIDIVAEDGEELVFVEVRTRRSSGYGMGYGTPQESLTPEKAEHLHLAAQDYLQNRVPEPGRDNLNWRIDLVSISFAAGKAGKGGIGPPLIEHLKYAVQL